MAPSPRPSVLFLTPPPLTPDDAVRIERALADASFWRGAELARAPGNAQRVEQRDSGRVRARRIELDLAYYGFFSELLDLQAGDEAVVPDLVAWFDQLNAPIFVRVSPLCSSESLLRALGLVEHGARPERQEPIALFERLLNDRDTRSSGCGPFDRSGVQQAHESRLSQAGGRECCG